jgi:hypothetical protein
MRFQDNIIIGHKISTYWPSVTLGKNIVGVLWRRHIKTLITTLLIGNRGKAATAPIPIVHGANQAAHKVPGNTSSCRTSLLDGQSLLNIFY